MYILLSFFRFSQYQQCIKKLFFFKAIPYGFYINYQIQKTVKILFALQ